MARRQSKRTAIRKAIIKALYGRTNAGQNVHSGRAQVNWQENLPAINIYMRGEEAEDQNQAPRLLKRVITFDVEIIADGKDGEDVEDKIDEIAEQVEICLSIDDSLNCTASDIVLSSISDIETVADGAKPTGSVRLLYDVTYHEYSPRNIRDQGTLHDFNKIGTQWQVGHHDEAPVMAVDDRAKDEIDPGG